MTEFMEIFLIFYKIPTGSMQIACKPRSFYLLFYFVHLLQQEKDTTFTRLK